MTIEDVSDLLEHTKRELKFAGLGDDVKELIKVFDRQQHNAASWHNTVEIFNKLLRFETSPPLNGEDDEWFEYSENKFQNERMHQYLKMEKIAVHTGAVV